MKKIPTLTEVQIKNFLSKVDRSGGIDACWIWLGHVASRGNRAVIGLNGVGYYASRVAYFICYKKDPGELLVCHTCDNSVCVNPNHLWADTQAANIADMDRKGRRNNDYNRNKTHCPQGHEYTPENTIVEIGGKKKTPYRKCRQCNSKRMRDKRKAAKAAKPIHQ